MWLNQAWCRDSTLDGPQWTAAKLDYPNNLALPSAFPCAGKSLLSIYARRWHLVIDHKCLEISLGKEERKNAWNIESLVPRFSCELLFFKIDQGWEEGGEICLSIVHQSKECSFPLRLSYWQFFEKSGGKNGGSSRAFMIISSPLHIYADLFLLHLDTRQTPGGSAIFKRL